jgi:hypothetical protein
MLVEKTVLTEGAVPSIVKVLTEDDTIIFRQTHRTQDRVEAMDFDELFASNEYDFQELALELGECYSCEKTVMDGDFEHSTCPYESDEVHKYCPYYDEVVSYLKEVLVEKLEEEEILLMEEERKE